MLNPNLWFIASTFSELTFSTNYCFGIGPGVKNTLTIFIEFKGSLIKMLRLGVLLLGIVCSVYGTNFLRVCSQDDSFEIHDTDCGRGAWLPEHLSPTCLCATGTWLLSENFCDESFTIVSGPSNGELACFPVTSKVRRFASLSGPTSTYKQFVMESNGKVLREVMSLEDSGMVETPISIIRLNANTSVYVSNEDWQKCVPGPVKTSIQIIHSTDKITYFKSMEEGKSCDDLRDKTKPYVRTNNTVFIIDNSNGAAWDFNTGMIEGGCDCNAVESRVMVKSEKEHEELLSTDGDYDEHASDINDLYDKSVDPILKQERLKDNARTTSSVLSRFKDYLLLNIQPPTIHVPTFEYIEYGKSVLIKKCPEINKHVVQSLVKIFKILLANVIGRFPETYPNNIDVNTHGRIIKSLQSCVAHQTIVNFTWDTTDCSGIKSVLINGSSIPLLLPPNVKFNSIPQSTDVVLELAWKLVLISHYACTSYFESHPDDLSFMYVKAQEFITLPYIMFRWENPSPKLTTAYKLLLPDLKLSKLAEQVDACVFSAFSSSVYKSWVNRPQSTSEFLRENIVSRSMDKLTHQDEDSNRKLLFNNKGYCVHNFNDPLKWTAVNAGVDATC